MPGFSSFDDFIQETTVNGKALRVDWNKNFNPTTAASAGEWHSLFRGAGNPTADSILNTGTNLLFQQLIEGTTTGANGIKHGGDVAPDYKSLINASAVTAAGTVVPATMVLVDLIGFYRVTSVTTTTAQATTNTLIARGTFTADAGTDIITHSFYNLLNYSTVQVSTTTTLPAGLSAATNYFVVKISDTTCKLATSYANAVAGTTIDITDAGTGTHTINNLLPRYTNGGGVQAMFLNTNATPLGAATPNLSIGYTNSVATASRATPTVLPIGKTAASNSLIIHSGNASGKYGPGIPLQAGDAGIRSIETITNSISYVSGEYSVVLFKPLISVPLTTLGVQAERDCTNFMPRIYDGACLTWLVYSGVNTPTNSSFSGHLDFAWG